MKTTSLTIATILILVLSDRSDATDPQPASEAWYVYVNKEVNYASEHVTKRTLADGNIEYRIESRTLVDLLGSRQEESAKATYVVASDLSPVSINALTMRPSGEVRIVGAVKGEHFRIRREANGLIRTSELELNQRPIFRAVLPDAIDRLPRQAGTDAVTLTLIDEETLRTEAAKCRVIENVDPSTAVWSIEIGSDVALAMGRLTFKAGKRESEEFTMPQYQLRRSSRQEAEQIKHLTLEGRDLLMFDVDQTIARTDLLVELGVKLRWKEVPLDMLQLSDARQSLVSHTTHGQEHEAVLRISSPDASSSESVEHLQPADRHTLLGKTRFIDPTDPDIVAKAQEWTRNCKNAQEKITALAENVSKYLSGGEMIVETLSGPDVLKCRKGKCSEYSVLFASLARSQDIPTRIVLGDRMVGGKWIGHMWNEVFVDEEQNNGSTNRRAGRWVTVDTTTNEVGSAPALIKFTHSDSVAGTQMARWALTNSLEVTVQDFQLRESSTDPNWKTGIVDGTYTNSEFGCRISTPSNDWKLKETSQPGQTIVQVVVPDKNVFIHFVAYSLPVPLSPGLAAKLRETRYQSSFKFYETLKMEPVKRAGGEWFCLEFRRNVGPKEKAKIPDAKLMKKSEYILHIEQRGFIITIVAEESAHAAYEAALLKFVDSFQLR